MSYETILYQVRNMIATITLNRPDKLNAMNRMMVDELIRAFDQADADDSVRAIPLARIGILTLSTAAGINTRPGISSSPVWPAHSNHRSKSRRRQCAQRPERGELPRTYE
jgi:hypothetical protein